MATRILTTKLESQTGPVSKPCDICCICTMETPVSVAPLAITRCIGAAPRYFGRRDGCTFNLCDGWKRSRTLEGMAWPKEALIIRWEGSGFVNGSGGYDYRVGCRYFVFAQKAGISQPMSQIHASYRGEVIHLGPGICPVILMALY